MSKGPTESKASGATPLERRLKTYDTVSTAIKSIDDKDLSSRIASGKVLSDGIGGTVVEIDINGTRVVAKQIRLTDLERRPDNLGSTKNLFNLPMYYQYGVGSAGFGAWRELEAHKMSTDWVRNGECTNFPLMYGSRVLPAAKRPPMNEEQLRQLEETIAYWGGSDAVRERLTAIHNASASVVVFLEHVPDRLDKWLGTQFNSGHAAVQPALTMAENQLNSTTSFMNSRGLLHFDAHSRNVLTDGQQLYFADFGLALSSKFALSPEEKDFFDKHQNYDRCLTVTHLRGMTRDMAKTMPSATPEEKTQKESYKAPQITAILDRYSPLADTMYDFFMKLREDKAKAEPYPTAKLDHFCAGIALKKQEQQRQALDALDLATFVLSPEVKQIATEMGAFAKTKPPLDVETKDKSQQTFAEKMASRTQHGSREV